MIESDDPSDPFSWKEHEHESKEEKEIPGLILRCSGDPVQYRCNLFLSQEFAEGEDQIIYEE